MKLTRQQYRAAVQACVTFKGNSVYGEPTPSGDYAVYSYGSHWPLFVYTASQGSEAAWYENADKYSVTTSNHRSYCHPLTNTVKVSCDVLRGMVR